MGDICHGSADYRPHSVSGLFLFLFLLKGRGKNGFCVFKGCLKIKNVIESYVLVNFKMFPICPFTQKG